MKVTLKKISLLFTLFLGMCMAGLAQANYHSKIVDIKLNGTSNIHDWEMVAASGTSTSAGITATGGNNYQINAVGKMSIAGVVKQTDLQATGKYNPADKSFTVTGVKKMKMTDYSVDPPKALMGTIKTGDAISISYTLKFTK